MARIKKLTSSNLTGGQSTSKVSKPTDLVSRKQTAAHANTKISAAADLRKLSMSSALTSKNIQFGSTSGTGVKSHSSTHTGNEWTNLLQTATSSSLASLVGGGFLEYGVNSLVSGLSSLFDGGNSKNETPLTRFTLPEPQQQSMYVTSEGLSASPGFADASAALHGAASQQGGGTGGIYGSMQAQSPLYRQSEIVQAVKNALLTSSSLNDVIAEI